MSLVVLGAGGQVGTALCQLAAGRGLPCRGFTRADLDITDAAAVASAVAGADFVANAAAYTAVDQAEREPERALAVNRDGVAVVASACAAAGVPLLHLSTDYVFDGTAGRPYGEDDAVAPLSVYGVSKAAGEAAVRQILPRHLIVRTAWVFAPGSRNFVTTMRHLASRQHAISVVDDQHGNPTAAADVAAVVLALAAVAGRPGFAGWGTYHFAGAPAVSRFEFARAILAGRPEVTLTAVPTAAMPTPARRPLNAVLDCRRIAERLGIAQPDWRPQIAALRQGEAWEAT